LVGDYVLLCGCLGVFKDFLELGQLCRVLTYAFAVLCVVGCIGYFYLGECDFFCGIVCCADFGGALEGHVFEHVGQAAVTLGVVCRTGVYQRVEAEHGSLWAFADEQRQSVGQNLYGGSFFKAGQILGLYGTA
jgi:hypothetical protein